MFTLGRLIALTFLLIFGDALAASRSASTPAFAHLSSLQQKEIDELEHRTFDYFRDSSSQKNGLAPDHWPKDDSGDYFGSIAATGFALTAYGIGVERGWMKRSDAAKRTLATLQFLHDAEQSDAPSASGDHGFFYHFLDMESGRRYGSRPSIELSSLDTAELMAGVLFSMSYFDRATKDEITIRRLADDLYRRVDWPWFTNGTPLFEGGWTPEHSYDHNFYRGYSEGLILYLVALGSPTHAPDSTSWTRWAESYDETWGEFQGQEHLGGGPLFWHQYAQSWIDFRGIQDEYMRRRNIDYFTNSQRATLSQRQYAIHNPLGWKAYSETIWGLTACNGPRGATPPGSPDRYASDSKTFYGYVARGIGLNYTVDDGTIAPTAAISSIAFTPEIVIPTIEAMKAQYGDAIYTRYGFVDAFNPSFTFTDRPLRTGKIVPNMGWTDSVYIGIDQGPILSMIENFRTELVWTVMKKNKYVQDGLRRAGFQNGWLEPKPQPSSH